MRMVLLAALAPLALASVIVGGLTKAQRAARKRSAAQAHDGSGRFAAPPTAAAIAFGCGGGDAGSAGGGNPL